MPGTDFYIRSILYKKQIEEFYVNIYCPDFSDLENEHWYFVLFGEGEGQMGED